MGVPCLIMASCNSRADEKSNPFFSEYNTPFDVPPFEKIHAKHYMPAFEKGMEEGRKDIQNLLSNSEEPNFENTIGAFDRAGKLLTKVASVFFAQASANTSDSLQAIEMEISPRLSAYQDEIILNPELFSRVKHVYDNQASESLSDEQKFILENLYKEFVRNGANLNTVGRIRSGTSTRSCRFSRYSLTRMFWQRQITTSYLLTGKVSRDCLSQ